MPVIPERGDSTIAVNSKQLKILHIIKAKTGMNLKDQMHYMIEWWVSKYPELEDDLLPIAYESEWDDEHGADPTLNGD